MVSKVVPSEVIALDTVLAGTWMTFTEDSEIQASDLVSGYRVLRRFQSLYYIRHCWWRPALGVAWPTAVLVFLHHRCSSRLGVVNM
jgi:hypothetical protein